jgi:threonine aldolase
MLIAMFAVTQAVGIGFCVGALVMHSTELARRAPHVRRAVQRAGPAMPRCRRPMMP